MLISATSANAILGGQQLAQAVDVSTALFYCGNHPIAPTTAMLTA